MPTPVAAGTVILVRHGWHTDLAIPAEDLRGPMARFRQVFPGLKLLLVGFGRRSFMMAPVTGLGDLLVGPFPGNGVVLMAGLSAAPDTAYADGEEMRLALPPGSAEGLSEFVWRTLRTRQGEPVRIGAGFFPGSLFYETATGYSGAYTCNTWTADALHAAGLAVDETGVMFAGQVMSRGAALGTPACAIGGRP